MSGRLQLSAKGLRRREAAASDDHVGVLKGRGIHQPGIGRSAARPTQGGPIAMVDGTDGGWTITGSYTVEKGQAEDRRRRDFRRFGSAVGGWTMVWKARRLKHGPTRLARPVRLLLRDAPPILFLPFLPAPELRLRKRLLPRREPRIQPITTPISSTTG